MSFINYEIVSDLADKRVIKSRKAIFKSLVHLLAEKPVDRISVSELCTLASISRNTFYSQFKSVRSAFESMEVHIIISYLKMLFENNILSDGTFHPAGFILYTDKLRNDYRKGFDAIYHEVHNTSFFRQLGIQVELMGESFYKNSERGPDNFPGHYISALIFSISGLMNMYFDWIDNGEIVSVQDLASLAEELLTDSLSKLVNNRPEW